MATQKTCSYSDNKFQTDHGKLSDNRKYTDDNKVTDIQLKKNCKKQYDQS